jgi:hypothetical protein
MLKMLFSPTSERNDEVAGLVSAAVNATVDASNQLTQTIREMMDENDRVTGRKKNAEKHHR